ncbi:PMD domain-containing protein [Abeliophyllum distichum]|uniref:PMD domain-containing protein n=1 Tax=Abeliophyllum distichum TaxID=126358 RepID=A0ABD1QV29_9LAMI
MASTNSFSFEDYQTFLSQPFITSGSLLLANTRHHEFHLDPAFNVADAVGHSPVVHIFFTSYTFPFLKPLLLPSLCNASIRTWAKSGPMSITLRDISALTDLPPIGAAISPAMVVTHTHSSIEKQFFGSYKQLLTFRDNTTAEPNHVDRVAFIHCCLCKFVICVPSIKPFIGYLPIFNEFAYGKLLNLGSFVLAGLYRDMATVQDQLCSSIFPTGGGPLWLAQLCLRAYFPYFGTPSSATHIRRSIPPSIVSQQSIVPEFLVIPTTEDPQSSELPTQTADRPPSSSIEETPVDIPIVEEPPRSFDKEKAPASSESQPQVDILPNLLREVLFLPKTSDEDADFVLQSVQALFTYWEQVQVSSIPRASSTTHFSTSYIPSTEDMDALKRTILSNTSFIDKYISRASADSQSELLVRLSEDLAAALGRPSLDLSASIRLTLRGIHIEVSLFLSENVKLRAKKMSFVQILA